MFSILLCSRCSFCFLIVSNSSLMVASKLRKNMTVPAYDGLPRRSRASKAFRTLTAARRIVALGCHAGRWAVALPSIKHSLAGFLHSLLVRINQVWGAQRLLLKSDSQHQIHSYNPMRPALAPMRDPLPRRVCEA